MLRNKTLFVVGAGASHEFKLPLGSELALQISTKLDVRFEHFGEERTGTGDHALFEQIRRKYPREADEYQKSGWLIRDGIVLANSIDDFLDLHRDDERTVRYGKAAIVKCVLEAEAKSTLYADKNNREAINFRSVADTWLVKLTRMLGKGVPRAKRAELFDQCSFVVFNYDRCIEQFFINALQPMYNIEENEAADIVGKAKIVHPYGVAGNLPALNKDRKGIDFGVTGVNCIELVSNIMTYSESVEAREINNMVAEAKCIVFLGFAFHEANLRLLAEQKTLQMKEIYGTAHGISGNDVAIIRIELWRWFKERSVMEGRVHLPHVSASKLFDHFSKSLFHR
jgi:hypothetical protein